MQETAVKLGELEGLSELEELDEFEEPGEVEENGGNSALAVED